MADPSHAAWLKRLTEWSEGYVAERAKLRGWYVIRVSDVGPRAAMAEGFYDKVILPDLQLLDVHAARYSRFVEVKAKTTGAYKFQKTGQWCTGTDFHKLVAYRKINATGNPVDMAIIHLKHRKTDIEYNPYLLWSPIADLPEPMRFIDPNNPGRELAVWDVSDGTGPFQHLGHLNVPLDILSEAALIKHKLHPWDQPPCLRQPRDRPPLQLDLDICQRAEIADD
jgi:hypothetical protein